MKKSIRLSLAGLLVAGVAACASPPPELVEARDTYSQVKEGPASEFAPAELQTAQEALNEAETAFKKDGKSDITRALAYRAQRYAQIAAVEADTYQARRQKEEAESTLLEESEQARKSLQGSLADKKAELQRQQDQLTNAKSSLESTRKSLEEAKKAGNLTEAQLAAKREEIREKEAALAAQEKKLAVTQTELKSERERREEAEKRLAEARKKLEEFAKVKEDEKQIVITLTGEVLFKLDESDLRPAAKARLDQVVEVLLTDRDRAVTVEGHTDSQGKPGYNQELSLKRAQSVRTYLLSQGISADRVQAIGKGETEPVASNDTPEGRALNRRVEIIIAKQ